MESASAAAAAGGVSAGRGVSLPPIPSASSSSSVQSPSRKEWRAVSEHSVRNSTNEELVRSNLGHSSDERTIYEHGSGPPDVDFCSINMDGSLDNDLLQQRLHAVSRQREELQHMEIELRAQVIARSEITDMQNSFDMQIKQHTNAAAMLKEKLQEREHAIHELELKMEEKDRELRAIKIDNEAAWAKEDLLREQNKELVTFRRERDNSEAERIQHLKQLHELNEHIQEKDRQFVELEEQHRVAQENILRRDEKLREAHAWMARAQEMDHSIQAEFRDRTEHWNQSYYHMQRMFQESEKHHLQIIKQLQLELADARERSGVYTDESRMAHADAKDASQFGHHNGNQFSVNESATSNGNSQVLPNGNVDGIAPFDSAGNASNKHEYGPGVPLVPSSLLGMGAFLPPGQIPAVHPYVMHQQGISQSVSSGNSHVPQSHLGQFHQISSHQQWPNQQAVSSHSQHMPSQSGPNFLSSSPHYNYEVSANGHILGSNYLDTQINPSQEPGLVISVSSQETQVLDSNDNSCLVAQQAQPSLEEGPSKLHEGLVLDSPQPNSGTKEQDGKAVNVANHLQEEGLAKDQSVPSAVSNQVSPSEAAEATASSSMGVLFSEVSVSSRRAPNSPTPAKNTEPILLDERSLLACIVRAIPAGSSGRIRISSTLPNRLGKMLAPLHWHDYKKKYGKLDDFVSSHPELFVIEGDLIHLREGAQEIISATAAVAKLAAATSTPYSSLMPSVAVTPMAQNHRLKKGLSIDSKTATATSTGLGDKSSQLPTVPSQHSNGVSYNIVQGLANVNFLRPNDSLEQNGQKSESRPGHSSVHVAVANGSTTDRTGHSSFQNKGLNNGRHGVSFGGKQPGRSSGAAVTSKK